MKVTDRSESKYPRSLNILGVPVSLIDLKGTASLVSDWSSEITARTVFVREVASLMAAVDEPYLQQLHHKADLVVADGTPLVWVGRALGYGSEIGRVAGADLVDEVCKRSLKTGQSHYFYGGRPGVAEAMIDSLSSRHSGLKVAGYYSPPMRSIGPDFQMNGDALKEVEDIKASGADFVWIGISSPKQEYWMMKAAPLLDRGVLFGVGAAFDFHAGSVKRAPRWMRESGFEWLHRLKSEPRRLWRRYLISAPRFVMAVAKDLMLSRVRVVGR